MTRLLRYPAALLGLAAVAACDATHAGPAGVVGTDRAPIAAAFPSMLGSYGGTAAAHVRTSGGHTYDVSCPLRVDVLTQTDDRFSGTVTVQDNDHCKGESGTVRGTVEADGALTVTAYTSDGTNVFESAAARSGCTLVRSSGSFSGELVGNVVTAAGNGVYDCPYFGGFRAFVDVTVSAART